MAGPTSGRGLRRRALATSAALAVVGAPVLLAASPASAQTTLNGSGATNTFALHLQVNLPSQLASQLDIDLLIDPTTGTIETTKPTATADASVLTSQGGLLKQILDNAGPLQGTSHADTSKPGPATASLTPSDIKTQTQGILNLGLIQSTAQVAKDGTSSTSTASVANLGLALGAQLGAAANQITGPLTDALNQAIAQLNAQLVGPLAGQLCTATGPTLTQILSALGLSQAVVGTLCDLPNVTTNLGKDLQTALTTLGDNVLSTGLIQTEQTIAKTATNVTSTATASIDNLSVLGGTPLADGTVLKSSATATATGTAGGATAAAVTPKLVDVTVGTIIKQQLATVEADLQGLTGTSLDSIPVQPPLTTIIQQVVDAVNQISTAVLGGNLVQTDTNSGAKFTSCPTTLPANQYAGTFTAADGSCAAAGTTGVSIVVTLPAALANALKLETATGASTNQLVALTLSPAAAVAKANAEVAPTGFTTGSPSAPPKLAFTGMTATGGILGLGLLAAAAVLFRRRRTSLHG